MSELGWEPTSGTVVGGDQSEVLLFTLLEPEELAGGDSITLHAPASASSTLISVDMDVKMETRLAMRDALLPSRRGGRHPRVDPAGRCGTCGQLPSSDGATCVCGNHVALDLDEGGAGDTLVTPELVAHIQPEAPAAGADASPHGCMFCARTFVRRSDLKSHLNLHLGIKKSVCDVCGRQFSHMSNLYRHMRTHTGERPYVCSVCHKRFSQANALSAHKEVHDPARSASHHPCTSCPKQFRKRPQLARHIKLMHRSPAPPSGRRQAGRRFHCGVCGASFPSRDQLLRHRESHPADSLHCGVCRLSFSTAEELTRHGCLPPATARHQEEEEEDAPPAAAAPLPARPQYDLLTDGGRSKAEVPAPSLLAAAAGDDDTEVDHLLDQMVTVHSVGTQYDVAEMLSLPAVAADAQLGSPPPSPASPNVADSDDADSVADAAVVEASNAGDDAAARAAAEADGEVALVTSGVLDAAVEQHVEQVIESVARLGPAPPPLPDRPAPPTTSSSGAKLACETCGRRFSRVQNLRQHEAMHDASLQQYRCPHCPRCFAWQQTRDRHVSREHRGEKRVACPHCHRLFLPGSLRGHLQRVHMKLRNYLCSVCNKAFHRKSEVEGHMRTHTQERPFVCSVCGKQFIHLSHMRRHEDRHHASAAHRAVLSEPTAATAEDGGRVTRTYRPRRARQTPAAPSGDADIVQHSLVTACIPLEEEEEEAVEQPPAAGQYVTLVGPASPEYVLLQLAQPTASGAADKGASVGLPAEEAAAEYVLCELEEPSTSPDEVKAESEALLE